MKKAGFIPKVLVFALIIFLMWTIFGLRGDITKANARRNEYKTQSMSYDVENDELRRRNESLKKLNERREQQAEDIDRLNELKAQVEGGESIETENAELRRRIDGLSRLDSAAEEIIEEIARDELGYVMPGEQVIYD